MASQYFTGESPDRRPGLGHLVFSKPSDRGIRARMTKAPARMTAPLDPTTIHQNEASGTRVVTSDAAAASKPT